VIPKVGGSVALNQSVQ